jgi:hypothetical protein
MNNYFKLYTPEGEVSIDSERHYPKCPVGGCDHIEYSETDALEKLVKHINIVHAGGYSTLPYKDKQE